jgi:cytochrome c-type biogenesis protein
MFVDPQAVTLPLAVLAGLVSFISPCVLPLVPAYIGYLTGQAANSVSSSLVASGNPAGEGSSIVPASPSRPAGSCFCTASFLSPVFR